MVVVIISFKESPRWSDNINDNPREINLLFHALELIFSFN